MCISSLLHNLLSLPLNDCLSVWASLSTTDSCFFHSIHRTTKPLCFSTGNRLLSTLQFLNVFRNSLSRTLFFSISVHLCVNTTCSYFSDIVGARCIFTLSADRILDQRFTGTAVQRALHVCLMSMSSFKHTCVSQCVMYNFCRFWPTLSPLSHKARQTLTCRLSLQHVLFLIRARVFITLRSCLVVPNVFRFPFLLRPREIEAHNLRNFYSRLAFMQWD